MWNLVFKFSLLRVCLWILLIARKFLFLIVPMVTPKILSNTIFLAKKTRSWLFFQGPLISHHSLLLNHFSQSILKDSLHNDSLDGFIKYHCLHTWRFSDYIPKLHIETQLKLVCWYAKCSWSEFLIDLAYGYIVLIYNFLLPGHFVI